LFCKAATYLKFCGGKRGKKIPKGERRGKKIPKGEIGPKIVSKRGKNVLE